MKHNCKLYYKNDSIYFNGETWRLIEVSAESETHVNFHIQHPVHGEDENILVSTQNIHSISKDTLSKFLELYSKYMTIFTGSVKQRNI